MPAPMTIAAPDWPLLRGDTGAERIARIETKGCFAGHVRRAANVRHECAIPPRGKPAGEQSAGDAFLPPDCVERELSARMQRGHLGGGAGAAWRTVIFSAGAQHVVAAIGVGAAGRRRDLDVVDVATICAGDAGCAQRILNGEREAREVVHARHLHRHLAGVGDVEPVPAPRDVARHATVAGHGHFHVARVHERGHVLDRDGAISRKLGTHRSDRGVEARHAGTNASEVLERANHADEAVPAHAEIRSVVEEDDSRRGALLHRRREERTHHRVVATRLADDRGAQVVLRPTHACEPVGHRGAGRLWPAIDHDARRLAFRVRVHHTNDRRKLDARGDGGAIGHGFTWTVLISV